VENNTTSTALSEVSVRLYSLVADIHLVRRCQSQLIVCIFIFKKNIWLSRWVLLYGVFVRSPVEAIYDERAVKTSNYRIKISALKASAD